MEIAERKDMAFNDGMKVSDLREMTSIKFINTLRENNLIRITRTGKIQLTERGKVASKLGIHNFLRLEKAESKYLEVELDKMKIEHRGLTMIFGGMVISLLLIIGFWIIELKVL
ncbi:hypothetical protein [Christiangramia sabulilitoris]|uniref:Uncharacterized protein n=1 Tax=Christiangramia sabulilitoris TaxID=2583991 RepID=A0A550I003_9FLAO|nr:hypothetical protein [Christiangramia sabulilitoris]TRO64148.1 hypothetical protein FGM01_11615 [Christiangramia sabulilitoris]